MRLSKIHILTESPPVDHPAIHVLRLFRRPLVPHVELVGHDARPARQLAPELRDQLQLSFGSKKMVTTVASWMSAWNRSSFRNVTRSPTPALTMSSRATRRWNGSISMPTPRAPTASRP